MFDTKFCENRSRPFNLWGIWIFLFFFYRDSNFFKFDVSTKLPLWGSQNQVTYFLKKRTLWNQWRSNMGISIHIFFLLQSRKRGACKKIKNIGTHANYYWLSFSCILTHKIIIIFNSYTAHPFFIAHHVKSFTR